MGLPPRGEVVGGEPVARACGCVEEFQHHAGDKYRPQRLAKFRDTRCAACAAKLQAEQQAAQRRASVPKAEALRQLPPGARVCLDLRSGGVWAGTLMAEGVSVEAAGPTGAGPQAVVAALARLWLRAGGAGADTGQKG